MNTFKTKAELQTKRDDIMDILQSELGGSQMDLVDELLTIVVELTTRHNVTK